MPDVVETPVETPVTDQTPQEPEPPMMEPEEEVAEEAKTPEVPEEVDISDVTKLEDGSLELIVDPDDPRSTRYRGKDMKELFANIRKGAKEKDTFIHKLRSEQISADSHRGKLVKKDDEESEVEFPKWGEILMSTAKENDVDPKMLGWNTAKWKEYADEQGLRDFEVIDIRDSVRRVNDIASARYNEGNVIAINDSMLDDETKQVKELVAELGVSEEFTADVYREILTQVMDDKANYKNGGVRKTGVIVKAAAKEIARLATAKSAKETKKKSDEAIASGKERKASLPADTPSRTTFKTPTSKPPATLDDALAELILEMKAGKHKDFK
jgi:hypothetical protein